MSKTYVVRGTNNGKEVFYAVDSSSGYPFASTWTAKKTDKLSEAVSWLDECGPTSSYANMNNPQVCEIRYFPVDVNYLIKSRNKLNDYVNNLNDEERKLLKGML